MLKHFNCTLYPASVPGSACHTDGHLTHGNFCYLITEANRAAGSKCEASLQSALYYAAFLNYLSTTMPITEVPVFPKADHSGLPCLHIYYSGQLFDALCNAHRLIPSPLGPQIGFAGSAASDRAHFDVLGTILPFSFHIIDSELRTQAARCFRAVNKATATICAHYEHIFPTLANLPPFERIHVLFPYPRDYSELGGDKKKVKFAVIAT